MKDLLICSALSLLFITFYYCFSPCCQEFVASNFRILITLFLVVSVTSLQCYNHYLHNLPMFAMYESAFLDIVK